MEAKEGVYGQTCLITAAYHGHLAICRLLIDKGAQVEAKNSHGNTPLHYAAAQGHVEIVRLLCDRGADIEARGNNGWRPLHSTVWKGHISVVKELIEERNAEINARDNRGKTALCWTKSTQYPPNPFAVLILAEHCPELIDYLISHGGLDLGEFEEEEEEEEEDEEEEEEDIHDEDD